MRWSFGRHETCLIGVVLFPGHIWYRADLIHFLVLRSLLDSIPFDLPNTSKTGFSFSIEVQFLACYQLGPMRKNTNRPLLRILACCDSLHVTNCRLLRFFTCYQQSWKWARDFYGPGSGLNFRISNRARA